MQFSEHFIKIKLDAKILRTQFVHNHIKHMPDIEKKKHKIALIEDDKVLSGALSEELEDQGFEVFRACNGEEGLEVVRKQRPDLILLDIMMPKMDGITMLENLRGDAWGSNVPVIILTNYDYPEVEKKAESMGVSEYMLKSQWKVEDIVERVKERFKEDD